MNSYYLEKMAEEKMRQFEKDATVFRTASRGAVKKQLVSFFSKMKIEHKKRNTACCA